MFKQIKNYRALRAFLLAFVVTAFSLPAQAHHYIWLDFSGLEANLASLFPTVNGHTPTQTDITDIKRRILSTMAQNYAPFDIYITDQQPRNGRYTQISFVRNSSSGYGNTQGIGSWIDGVSLSTVYLGKYAEKTEFQGANATSARLANAFAQTASHEAGHALGLHHGDAADDFREWNGDGCGPPGSVGSTGSIYSPAECSGDEVRHNTADQNVEYHIMAGSDPEVKATRDFFFSLHSSRRVLMTALQGRNFWAPLADVDQTNGDRADLTYGNPGSTTNMKWGNRLGTANNSFGAYRTMSDDAGNPDDIFMMGDIDGDGRKDLVIGSFISSGAVSWSFKRSTGSAFVDYHPGNPVYGPTSLCSDCGDVGDIFRMADVNGDGKDDLVMGRPYSSSTVKWYVYLAGVSSATGNYIFNGAQAWINDAGNEGDLFLLGDVTHNGFADLVAVRRDGSTVARVYESNGSSFIYRDTATIASQEADLVMLGNVNNNATSPADLVFAFVKNSEDVDWYAALSNSCSKTDCFNDAKLWSSTAGDAGDLFRLGDGNDDGLMDIFYGRWNGMKSRSDTPDLSLITWYGRYSTGSAFGSWYEWKHDSGDEGDMYP